LLAVGKRSTDALVEELGLPRAEGIAGKGVRFESYAGLGHGSSPQELEHLKAWCGTDSHRIQLNRLEADRVVLSSCRLAEVLPPI
jgi:hypothetical protein